MFRFSYEAPDTMSDWIKVGNPSVLKKIDFRHFMDCPLYGIRNVFPSFLNVSLSSGDNSTSSSKQGGTPIFTHEYSCLKLAGRLTKPPSQTS